MEKLVATAVFLAALICWRIDQTQSITHQSDGVVTEIFDLNKLLRENANPQVILQEETKGSVKTVEISADTNNVFQGSVQDSGSPAQQDLAYQQSLRKYQQDLNEYRRLLSQYREFSDNTNSKPAAMYVQTIQQTYSQPYQYQSYQLQPYQTQPYQTQPYQSPSYQYQPYQYQPTTYQSYTGYQQGSAFRQPTFQRNSNPLGLGAGSSVGSLLSNAGSTLFGGLFG
ncbi:uncharacterized protein LOC125955592 [Anopheles darlingi]|uniref:uncharacterized protein LOC125955592 n=1 Tax=Anopheles darlingi TaxID=43151 RepID=UPI0021005A28|nr:uncharacterized protein LOC125955592 [Anopheles darlingi]